MDAKLAPHLRHQLCCQQRMSSQLNKVIVPPDSLYLQHLAPDSRQFPLCLSLRHFVFSCTVPFFHLRQRAPHNLSSSSLFPPTPSIATPSLSLPSLPLFFRLV